MSSTCPKCGKTIDPSYSNCTQCGRRIAPLVSAEQPPPTSNRVAALEFEFPPSQTKSTFKTVFLQPPFTYAMGAIGLGLLVLVVSLSLGKSRSTAPTTTTPSTLSTPAPVSTTASATTPPPANNAPTSTPIQIPIFQAVSPTPETAIPAVMQRLGLIPKSGPAFSEVESRMSNRKKSQRDAYWRYVVGTHITWTGQVTGVKTSGVGELSLRCNPQSSSSDVLVTLDGSQISGLPTINQYITFSGVLESHGKATYSITKGHIESVG